MELSTTVNGCTYKGFCPARETTPASSVTIGSRNRKARIGLHRLCRSPHTSRPFHTLFSMVTDRAFPSSTYPTTGTPPKLSPGRYRYSRRCLDTG